MELRAILCVVLAFTRLRSNLADWETSGKNLTWVYDVKNPVTTQNQTYKLNPETGAFRYHFDVSLTDSYKFETQSSDAVTMGCYGWKDASNRWHPMNYVADSHGWRTISNISQPIDVYPTFDEHTTRTFLDNLPQCLGYALESAPIKEFVFTKPAPFNFTKHHDDHVPHESEHVHHVFNISKSEPVPKLQRKFVTSSFGADTDQRLNIKSSADKSRPPPILQFKETQLGFPPEAKSFGESKTRLPTSRTPTNPFDSSSFVKNVSPDSPKLDSISQLTQPISSNHIGSEISTGEFAEKQRVLTNAPLSFELSSPQSQPPSSQKVPLDKAVPSLLSSKNFELKNSKSGPILPAYIGKSTPDKTQILNGEQPLGIDQPGSVSITSSGPNTPATTIRESNKVSGSPPDDRFIGDDYRKPKSPQFDSKKSLLNDPGETRLGQPRKEISLISGQRNVIAQTGVAAPQSPFIAGKVPDVTTSYRSTAYESPPSSVYDSPPSVFNGVVQEKQVTVSSLDLPESHPTSASTTAPIGIRPKLELYDRAQEDSSDKPFTSPYGEAIPPSPAANIKIKTLPIRRPFSGTKNSLKSTSDDQLLHYDEKRPFSLGPRTDVDAGNGPENYDQKTLSILKESSGPKQQKDGKGFSTPDSLRITSNLEREIYNDEQSPGRITSGLNDPIQFSNDKPTDKILNNIPQTIIPEMPIKEVKEAYTVSFVSQVSPLLQTKESDKIYLENNEPASQSGPSKEQEHGEVTIAAGLPPSADKNIKTQQIDKHINSGESLGNPVPLDGSLLSPGYQIKGHNYDGTYFSPSRQPVAEENYSKIISHASGGSPLTASDFTAKKPNDATLKSVPQVPSYPQNGRPKIDVIAQGPPLFNTPEQLRQQVHGKILTVDINKDALDIKSNSFPARSNARDDGPGLYGNGRPTKADFSKSYENTSAGLLKNTPILTASGTPSGTVSDRSASYQTRQPNDRSRPNEGSEIPTLQQNKDTKIPNTSIFASSGIPSGTLSTHSGSYPTRTAYDISRPVGDGYKPAQQHDEVTGVLNNPILTSSGRSGSYVTKKPYESSRPAVGSIPVLVKDKNMGAKGSLKELFENSHQLNKPSVEAVSGPNSLGGTLNQQTDPSRYPYRADYPVQLPQGKSIPEIHSGPSLLLLDVPTTLRTLEGTTPALQRPQSSYGIDSHTASKYDNSPDLGPVTTYIPSPTASSGPPTTKTQSSYGIDSHTASKYDNSPDLGPVITYIPSPTASSGPPTTETPYFLTPPKDSGPYCTCSCPRV